MQHHLPPYATLVRPQNPERRNLQGLSHVQYSQEANNNNNNNKMKRVMSALLGNVTCQPLLARTARRHDVWRTYAARR